MPHPSHRESVEPFATLCPGSHPAYCQCDTITATIDWTLDATRSPDAEFIAHARADIDYLLSEAARLQSAVVDAYHNGYADGQASNTIKVTTVHAYEDGVRDERSRISEALETLPLVLADDEGTPVDGFTRTDVRRIVHDVPTLSECAGDAD